MIIKKSVVSNGRRHGLRARPALVEARGAKTVLTYESGAQVYHWTTDRPRARIVLKH